MAKRKRNTTTAEQAVKQNTVPEPKLTRTGYQITLWTVLAGLVAQLVMAAMVYPTLPAQIPSSWIGQLVKGETIPAWTVFVVFPVGQVVLLLMTLFSPKDRDGKPIMESGKAWTLTILALLFTVLQASAFHLPKAQ